MKPNTGNKMRLGVFVFITLSLFIAGIYFIGQRQQLFGSTFHVSGIFKDVSGLQVGNNVRFSGINIGVIDDVQQITDSTVQVTMLIDEHARKFMKKNVKAIIGSDGLMGNKLVILIPGIPGQPQLANNDIVETVKPVSMDDILLKINVTSNNAANITGNLAFIVENIRNGRGTIGKLFMDTVFAQNIDQTIVNIRQGAGGFKQNMNAASHNIFLRGFFKKKKSEKGGDKPDVLTEKK